MNSFTLNVNLKMLHVSIRFIVVVIAIIAADFALLRYMVDLIMLGPIRSGGEDRVRALLFTTMSILPMVNILVARLDQLVFSREKRRDYLIGFEIAGIGAVFATMFYMLAAPAYLRIDQILFSLLWRLPVYKDSYMKIHHNYGYGVMIAYEQLRLLVIFTPMQLLVAYAGGRAATTQRRQRP